VCRLETANERENIELIYRVSRARTFCAVVEVNEKDPESYGQGRLSELIGEAAATTGLGSLTAQLPLDFAHSLGAVLQKWTAQKSPLQIVLYAGVLVEPDWAHICTAGDIRVHLLENDAFKAVTRDHNYIDDPSDSPEILARGIPREILLWAPTRSIGPPSGRPPECLHWPLTPESSIEIYGSRFHRYRDPRSYVGASKGRDGAPATEEPHFFTRISQKW
jgi:serine/threonine protein phosphatase PrpC